MNKQMKKALLFSLALCLCLCLAFALPALAKSKTVDLNKATVKELMAIPELEIPEKLAKAIVAHREKNGPFKKAEDFLKVPGMTQDFMESLNPQFKDGKCYHDPDAEPALAPSKC